jgi:cation transport regulator ChaC
MTTAGLGPQRDEKMGQVLYFAYGSNLDDAQMRERCASARVVGRATLPNHALVFGGFSHRWGGAVASAVRTKGASVEGLLYELGDVDLRALDRFEGHPFAYERVVKLVLDEHGRRRRATTYIQPEDGFEAWTPPRAYFSVLWRAYGRLGFDFEPLARALGGQP